jgi:hypothetical protein
MRQDAIRTASHHGYSGQLPLDLHQVHLARTLMGLRWVEAAEGLLDKARIRLSQEPCPARSSVPELAETSAELYLQRHEAQPGLGFDAKVESWRRIREAMKEDPSRPAAEFLPDMKAAG